MSNHSRKGIRASTAPKAKIPFVPWNFTSKRRPKLRSEGQNFEMNSKMYKREDSARQGGSTICTVIPSEWHFVVVEVNECNKSKDHKLTKSKFSSLFVYSVIFQIYTLIIIRIPSSSLTLRADIVAYTYETKPTQGQV